MDPQIKIPMIILTDEEIGKILIERIDIRHESVGIVVGVIGSNERHIISHGHLDGGDPRPLNGDTIFEIGSITKVFTSLLLSDMVLRGQVSLDDPVTKYLPPTVRMPERNGRTITLVDLSTHTSGLPRMPGNFSPKNNGNPYADYTIDQLYQFLSNYSLTRDIGSQFEYSNLGGGLLGHVLARRANTNYETLVRSRICDLLGMQDTGITFSPDMKKRLAVGHDVELKPAENWDIPTLAGAGALRSTVNDLLIFLSAYLGFTNSSLTPAMAAMLKVRRPRGLPGSEHALGWGIYQRDGMEIISHSGGTGGYCSWIGYNAGDRIGVVVLSNAACPVDDIGYHLLDASFPLSKPPLERTAIKVDTKNFDNYLGNYQLGPKLIITVSREGDRLFTWSAMRGKIEIFPESDRDYFFKVADVQFTFVTGDDGRATELIVHQYGGSYHAKRVE